MKFKLRNFFGVYNEGQRKVLCILGIKIKLKKRAKEHSKKISEKYLKQLLGNPQVVAVLRSYTLPSINRDEIASLAENLNRKGINQEPGRKHEVIVCLTSYPKRMYDIHLCLQDMLLVRTVRFQDPVDLRQGFLGLLLHRCIRRIANDA